MVNTKELYISQTHADMIIDEFNNQFENLRDKWTPNSNDSAEVAARKAELMNRMTIAREVFMTFLDTGKVVIPD